MAKDRLFMEVENYRGYDSFMIPVNSKDKTWKSILDDIQSVLDEKYGNNDDEIEGINLNIKFVMMNPQDIEFENDF